MSRRAKFTTPEEKDALREDAERASQQKAARENARRLATNERARERRVAKNAGKKLCSVTWIKPMDLLQYASGPSVDTLVPTPLDAVCKKCVRLMQPRLAHTGSDDGPCTCLSCGKGLVWKACCVTCNAHLFPLG